MGEAYLLNHGGGSFLGLTAIVSPPTTYYTGQYIDMSGAIIGAVVGGKTIPLHSSAYTYSPTVPVTSAVNAITVTATVGSASKTLSIPITVSPVSSVFGENTWEQIAAVSAAGLAGDLWSVGDTKTTTINGSSVTLRIIGFNHDTLSSADARYSDATYNGGTGKAGITLQWTTAAGRGKMNQTASNTGGWAASYMNTTTLPALFTSMPNDMKAVIRTVDKYSCIGGSASANRNTATSAADQLFILSSNEIYASPSAVAPVEATYCSQYAYYAGISNPQKANYYEWIRSPHDPPDCEGDHFLAILLDGTQRANNDNINRANVSNDYYPAFCI